jgi:hypothetical protein
MSSYTLKMLLMLLGSLVQSTLHLSRVYTLKSEVKRAAHVINITVQHVEADPYEFWSTESWQDVQIILRLYTSPAEVLLCFDVDCCCIGYDGRNV